MTLFEKYGGFDNVSALVGKFYEKVLGDVEVSRYFEGVDMSTLAYHQACFLSMAMGGPANQYTGRTLKHAHQNLKITERDFNTVARLLSETLNEGGVESGDVATIIGIVAKVKGDLVTV